MINFLDKLIPLLLGHFVADFAIQTDTVALNKCPKNKSKIIWVWWMTGHVSIHGLIVYFLTGSSLIALLEALLHFYIDYLKCIGKFNLLVDQILHLSCKCLWVFLI